jgi:hypothetical protein
VWPDIKRLCLGAGLVCGVELLEGEGAARVYADSEDPAGWGVFSVLLGSVSDRQPARPTDPALPRIGRSATRCFLLACYPPMKDVQIFQYILFARRQKLENNEPVERSRTKPVGQLRHSDHGAWRAFIR